VVFGLGAGFTLANEEMAPAVAKVGVATYLEEDPRIERAAALGPGVLQYHSPSQDVVNLDGLTNPQAYQACKEGRIAEYLEEEGVTHAVESPSGVFHELWRTHDVELEPVQRFEGSGRQVEAGTGWPSVSVETTETVVYRIDRG